MVRIARILICLALGLLGILVLLPGAAIADATPTPTPTPTPEKIEINPTYPRIEAIAGSSFTFEVELKFTGDNPKVFDLQAVGPKGWEVYMTPQYQKDVKISSIRLEPAFTTGTKISVIANAPFYPLPDPGSYKITLNASSATIKGGSDLTAVITAKYQLVVISANQRLNTTAQPGKDSFFAAKIQNMGSATIDKINFSSTKPEGWTIEFKPDKVDSLAALSENDVQVNIKPDAKTIAGDYMVSLTASGTQSSSQRIDIRVTVETPSVWGWVGVAIIAVVVIGLALIFTRFSRR